MNMKNSKLFITLILFALSKSLGAQKIKLESTALEPNKVTMSFEKLNGRKVLRVLKDSMVIPVDEPTFVRVKNINFKNGVIEVKVLSRLLKNAPVFSRGFIGVAFRIDDKNATFESIYIRPTNGRADDQVRRNHSIQYFSYPDFKFDRLRKAAPETYETYADMGLNEWITMRIEVKGEAAKLFLNNSKYPVLIVNDLKHGDHAQGGIGLWVDIGTEGFFKDLKVEQQAD